MQSLFQQIKAGQLWDFHGGIHPPARKQQTQQKPIGRMSLPDRLYVPLRQHIGVAGTVLVQPGDRVLKGQPLTYASNAMAVPVHAPTSGSVLAIEAHPSAHPSALPEPCVVIVPDGLEQWRERFPLDLESAQRHELLERIQQAGIAGMGGAGFPTHIKSAASTGVDYLIINAVECEPYITADAVLMQEYATTIVKGIDILCQLLNPAAVLIGIEDDKPDAITAMQAATSQRDSYLVRVVPAKYPSGGEKQLIQLLTSKEVPAGRRPLDIGIVMQNVGTAFAIAQAVLDDIPLISRIVTVVGQTLSQPQNIHALIGTPVGTLLDHCGFAPEINQRVIMGGPMMGFTLPSLQVPLVKTSNCILAPTQAELPVAGAELDCIRCGACAEVCPATLLPQQLLWYSKAKDQDKLKEYNLADCIECGACAYVCPSEIPLVHYYRVAKAEIREQSREELKAEQAKARFEARNERLEREKQQRNARNQALAAQRQQQMAEQQKQREVAAAQARIQASHVESPAETLSREQIIAAREQKKAEARAYQQAKSAAETTNKTAIVNETVTSSDGEPANVNETASSNRSDAVAAAIARAKAKKAQQQDGAAAESAGQPEIKTAEIKTPTLSGAGEVDSAAAADPRAAAVAAAIARAKAKKAQQQDGSAAETAGQAELQPATLAAAGEADSAAAADPRAAAVAAAIARAKAKKAQQQDGSAVETAGQAELKPATFAAAGEADSEIKTPTLSGAGEVDSAAAADPRAAAVAAAIARAKAKKAQQQDGSAVETAGQAELKPATLAAAGEADSAAAADPRAAAVAAAIARAKAKKAQQQTEVNAQTDSPAEYKPATFAKELEPALAEHKPATHAVESNAETAADLKAAAIAAAIARAKAKKAQQATEPKDPA